jgi:hypothetical protein
MLARLAPLILLAMAMDFADFPRLQIAELLHRRNGLDAGALERAWKREEDAILGAPRRTALCSRSANFLTGCMGRLLSR